MYDHTHYIVEEISFVVETESKMHYVLIKDFNTFMYDHTHYIVQKIIFVVITYRPLVQQKY